MEISNPVASQYVSNQGITARLNTPASQLPVRSDNFSVERRDQDASGNPSRNVDANEDRNQSAAAERAEYQSSPAADTYTQSSPASSTPVTYDGAGQLQRRLQVSGGTLPADSQGINNANGVAAPSLPIQNYRQVSNLDGSMQSLSSSRVDYFI